MVNLKHTNLKLTVQNAISLGVASNGNRMNIHTMDISWDIMEIC